MELLTGIRLGGYRSIPFDPPAELAPLSKVNLIAGQNNSGKSNLLRYIHALFTSDAGRLDTDHEGPWDKPLGVGDGVYRFAIGVSVDEMVDRLDGHYTPRQRGAFSDALNDTLTHMGALENGICWFTYTCSSLQPLSSGKWKYDEEFLTSLYNRATQPGVQAAQRFGRGYLDLRAGTRVKDVYGPLLGALGPTIEAMPPARTVVAFRRISKGDDSELGLSGVNLIRGLHELQHPTMDRQEDKLRFEQIAEFVRAVLEDPSVNIEIPHDLGTIHVTRGGRTLPLENLGTGIHEVVILAAAATVVEESIVCIEEPEIHLHPTLQRKLLAYLNNETSNQYFIATHSAHMLDSARSSVFHVRHNGTRSEVSYAGHPRDRAEICADLGYRASDLVQANAVIWVEGPSDRTYVNGWIALVAPDLVEGTHYSVMFYGGRLLSHLSSHDPEVSEFISLRRLNRYMVIMIDSDKPTAHSHLAATKKRIRGEFDESGPGFAFITQGYTIENYVPAGLLMGALAAVHPSKPLPQSAQRQFESPLSEARLGWTADKVKIARHVMANWGDEWPLDLRPKVNRIIELIRGANH